MSVPEGYRVDERNPEMLIAAEYPDGTILGIYVTSVDEARASFYRYGPRGGLRCPIPFAGTTREIDTWSLRLLDARRHVMVVERWRRERFGIAGDA